MPKSCCSATEKDKKCVRKKDGKEFSLPRKFSKQKCKEGVKGFTARSSCAPFQGCGGAMSSPTKRKKEFLYNKNNPKKSFDVYIDKNPKDTIPIKYSNLRDVKSTIRKLEKLYKDGEYPHKRIKQVAMIMMVRLRAMDGKKEETDLAERYHTFLGERTKTKGEESRKKMKFK